MRTVTIGDKQIALRANPSSSTIARLLAGHDGCVMHLSQQMQTGRRAFWLDLVGIFQLACHAQGAELNKVQMSFEEWLSQFDACLGEEENW